MLFWLLQRWTTSLMVMSPPAPEPCICERSSPRSSALRLAAFVAFTWWVIPFALLMAFVVERARFSILVATVMHGAANIALPILLPGVDRIWTLVATGTLYAIVAGALVIHSVATSRRPTTARFYTKEVAA